MFSLWLLFFREHCAVFVSLFVLLPATLLVNWRLGSLLLVLIALSGVAINFVVRRTQAKNGEANDVYSDIGKQVSDVLGNLPAVQSFTRIEAETREFSRADPALSRRAVSGAQMVGFRRRSRRARARR